MKTKTGFARVPCPMALCQNEAGRKPQVFSKTFGWDQHGDIAANRVAHRRDRLNSAAMAS